MKQQNTQKVYATPKLVVHGTVEQLTQSTFVTGSGDVYNTNLAGVCPSSTEQGAGYCP